METLIVRQIATRFSLLSLLLLLPLQPALSEEWRFDGVERVVAIADIHGAYDAMVATLQSSDILAEDLSWIGGKSHLVIVGDILDRGPKSRAAMDLLMRLETEAVAAGGQVHVVIGNHESMLLTGDLRYVSAAEYAAFADEEDAAERARWFELYLQRTGGAAGEIQSDFDKKFPQGYFAMRRAFRPDGRYGKWLLSKNIIVVIDGTAFVHGGLAPVVAEVGLDGINGRLQRELVDYVNTLAALSDAEILLPTDSHYNYEDVLNDYLPGLNEDAAVLQAVADGKRLLNSVLISTEGPLWYRNNVLCPGIVEEHKLEAALAAIDAKRVVIGHTPTPNRQVMQKYNGRVIEIDTGMLNFYYNGIGHALVLEGDSISVTSQTDVDGLQPMPHPRGVGDRPGGLSALELEEFLQSNEIVAIDEADDRTVVRVSDGKNTISAIFDKQKGRGFYPGVAAYRLDRLLNLEMVPVTVVREVDGKPGSLQFLPENTTDEAQRSAAGAGGGAWCSLSEQWPAMYVFDVLIFNEGRSQRRMLYDTSSWRLMLSEHDRAFATKKGRPAHLRSAPLTITPGWKDALAALSNEVLEKNLGDVLDKRRLTALQARRDELLASP
jgi:hypothetical protein